MRPPMSKRQDIRENLATVLQRIRLAALDCGRDPGSVRLVTVAKNQTDEAVRRAVESGALIIGENYIQEARGKFDALIDRPARWHFIGHLQSNKAKIAVRLFEMIHTVDSAKLAAELNKQARQAGKIQDILVQVNISGEPSKSGVAQEQTLDLIETISRFEHIAVRGLMTLPPYFDAPQRARPFFTALRQLRDQARQSLNLPMQELSMGMTGDFEVAIQEGATLVRIGTAIFGGR
jgi:PLP dependent protein